MSTARRDVLVAIEEAAQKDWEKKKLNEWDAPVAPGEGEVDPPKFFTTFPFPYMNGMLHLGHAYSFTKAEFTSRYERMTGKKSLWAFGFHATGMPIAACAKKIVKEMEAYGNPPQFPEVDVTSAPTESTTEATAPLGSFKSKRGKSGPAKPQWCIMQQMGIPDEEIAKFADPLHWLEYFPPLALEDLKRFGCHIDYRRSFITTEQSRYFDRFVKWQFEHLYEQKKLSYGKRNCIYSPMDAQPCADHDRSSGEGIQIQEYAVVKLRVQNPKEQEAFKKFSHIVDEKPVVIACATLRLETVVGLTNCWVSPSVTYKAYSVENAQGKEEIFIMTGRAARNMAYQGFVLNGSTNCDPTPLFEVNGCELIGLPVSAPLAPYDTIYCLPMATISENKGTGCVMSVPSDSPDDYVNFSQLVKKPDYRLKLNIKDEWVVPFELVPIIDIPELGTESAKTICESMKINGPNAKDLLEGAKKIVYQKSFYSGVMICGPFKGEKVSVAKIKSQSMLEASGDAIRYFEPNGLVVSRSGDECVVSLQNQWYLEYGKNEEWKQAVLEYLKNVRTYSSAVRNGFEETLNWMQEWACSRTFGLGTYIPSDNTHTHLIESLSDSTIYMAYYTISKFMHNDVDGKLTLFADRPNKYGLQPEMFTRKTFDYIFLGKGNVSEVAAAVGMPEETLQEMRREFTYWYPVDLRCSGKDLIQNHLTMFLYNHLAIWPDDSSKWPKGIFCNGHVQVDNEKMAKSKGNFITLREAVETYGADATRLACADAGDTLDDANFVRETASGFVLKLTTILQQAEELLGDKSLSSRELQWFDRMLNNTMNILIERTKSFYENMHFRLVLNSAYHELTAEFSQYKQNVSNDVHLGVTRRYYEVLTLLLTPLAPHFSEHMWQKVLKNEGNAVLQPFPKPDCPVSISLTVSHRIIKDIIKGIRTQVLKISKKRPDVDMVVVYAASEYEEWQKKALILLKSIYEEHNQSIPPNISKIVLGMKQEWVTKQLIPDVLAFVNFMGAQTESFGVDAISLEPAVNDYDLLSELHLSLAKLSGVKSVVVLRNTDTQYDAHRVIRSKSRPGEPSVGFPPVSTETK